MPQFGYTGRHKNGDSVNGVLEAVTAESAAGQLMGQEIIPLTIEEQSANGHYALPEFLQKNIPLEDLILFARQMYSLSKAGVPITRAMRGLAQSMRHLRFKKILLAVTDNLEAGVDLAGCLRQHPTVFNDLFVNLIRVGEQSGNLDQSFLKIAQYFELERTTRRRIKSATRYPAIVVVFVVIAIGVINYFVIPAFANMFEKFHAQLPWQTRVLMAMSNFTVEYGVYLLLSIIGAITYGYFYLQTPVGRYQKDKWLLKVPIMGSILLRIALGRFSRTFAMMLRSGVPVISSLHTVSEAIGNVFLGEHIKAMAASIERGESLPIAAYNTQMFSPLVLQMLAVGDETGQMDDMLDEAADFYEEEVDYDLNRLSQLLEPIMITVIGVMVLILALGVFLPMWDLSTVAFKKG